MGHTSRSIENSGTKNDLNCGDMAQEVSKEKKIMLPRVCSRDILTKNVPAFCPCPKSLSEA